MTFEIQWNDGDEESIEVPSIHPIPSQEAKWFRIVANDNHTEYINLDKVRSIRVIP